MNFEVPNLDPFSKNDSGNALAFIIQEVLQQGSIMLDFCCTAKEVGDDLNSLGFFYFVIIQIF